jgi:excisionase family DNA binding protein
VSAYLTVAEFAELAGLEKQQVLNRIHRNKIPGARKRGWFWEIPRRALSKHKSKK